ncbi:Sentrin-specific protease 7 [Phytophthora cinnamomi]|uniref:Sentrin-specific protease 7 n=1 Tax=Phytophthora cinnamomi TaxID=4785 RepID=UPI0035599E57|nr:Sentrin-specific protease 7 [Phytophthora cinnamomi]
MRLGLTSPSLRMGAQTSATRRSPPPLSRASAFSPIDVDGDSSDDAEPRSSPGPSLSTRTLHYESSDDSESKQSEHKDDLERSRSRSSSVGAERGPQQADKGQRLNFFFQYGSPRQRRRRDAQLSGSSAQSSPAKDELHEVICAPRTNVCGEKYDRCEMEFQQDRVELTIWQAGKRQWQGEVQYAHLGRFCFSRVDRPPYILLLQLDGAKGRSNFADWYDSVFARVCSKKNEKEVMTPKVFGVVFYFDEEMEVMRCQSMGDSNPRLAQLFSEKLSDSERKRRAKSRRSEVLLTYPYDGSDTAGRISVTLGDVDRLVPGEFLNDNIIDFYLRFLWRHLAPWQQQQTYFFTSHFFTQLNGTNGAHELTTADPDERFARVARWTQKETNLFEKRFLFIPINDSFHWSIAVLCNPGSAIIKKHRKEKNELGADAVGEEETIVTSFDSEGIGLLEPNVPLQSNSSDCGVFLLMYAALIVGHFPAGVTREDLESNLTSTLKPTMFKDEHVLEFREYLQQLIFSLQFLEKHGLPEEKVKEEELEVFNID